MKKLIVAAGLAFFATAAIAQTSTTTQTTTTTTQTDNGKGIDNVARTTQSGTNKGTTVSAAAHNRNAARKAMKRKKAGTISTTTTTDVRVETAAKPKRAGNSHGAHRNGAVKAKATGHAKH